MSKRRVLQLYKSLITESKKLTAYNYRLYALRKVRDSFQKNKNLTDKEEIERRIFEGEKSLEMIKRQVVISQLYGTERLVIEHLMPQNK